MRIVLIVLTTLLVLAACSPTSTVIPESATTVPSSVAPSADGGSPTGLSTEVAAPTQASVPGTTNAAPEALQVLSPQDGAVVNTQQVTVMGVASPGAVVTVNDDILIAAADGKWQDTVTLDEGPNVIEIIASNTSGNEASVELAVIYEP